MRSHFVQGHEECLVQEPVESNESDCRKFRSTRGKDGRESVARPFVGPTGSSTRQDPYVRSALGARAVEIFDVGRATVSSECSVAVVGTGSEPDGAGMRAIRDLKRQGFEIVAYEGGTESWSVKLRCLSLLARATRLLDSGTTNFDGQLQNVLKRFFALRRAVRRRPNK
jgi:hypothetical protein